MMYRMKASVTKIRIFLGMLKAHSNKTATALKANAITAYSVHVVLLNSTKEFLWNLIEHGHTFADLLPSMISDLGQDQELYTGSDMFHNLIVDVVRLSDDLPARTDRNEKPVKLQILYEARRQILSPLNTQVWSGFQGTACAKVWNCQPMIVSYCCDTLEDRDTPGVRHGATICPCVSCLKEKMIFLDCLLEKIGLGQVWTIRTSRLNYFKQKANCY